MFKPINVRNAADAPDFEEEVRAAGRVRLVYGTVRLLPTKGQGAAVQAQIETHPGSGDYYVVFEDANPAGEKVATRHFFFAVPGGCHYRFSKFGVGPSDTEYILNYNYTDL